jgi:hypothetical protein
MTTQLFVENRGPENIVGTHDGTVYSLSPSQSATIYVHAGSVVFFGESKPSPEDGPRHDRLLRYFEYSHLPSHLQQVSSLFWWMANHLCCSIDPGPERTVALRKLLESKDAAVRARLDLGG